MALISRREQQKLEKRFEAVPAAIKRHVLDAHEKNAAEANGYLNAFVSRDTGKTASNTFAFAYQNRSQGEIGMQMQTARANRPSDTDSKDERIKAILFANPGGDYFYGTWRNFRKRWAGRAKRGMTKGAKEFYNV